MDGGAFIVSYVIVALIGGAVGAGELVTRYRDDPWAVLLSAPAFLYLLINIAAAALAFYFVTTYQILPEATTDLTKVFAAGFGAMALFRTSTFTARIGETDIAIGPSFFLQIILAATDRAIDRNQAVHRARIVTEIMKDISFDKAKTSLPVFCFALMQNVGQTEQQKVGTAIRELASNDSMDDTMRAYSLGLILINIVGEDVLREAVVRSKDKLQS